MSARPTLYGIANCDTVKRARAWLAERGGELAFHDYRRSGVPAERLTAWCDALGWQRLINARGTTWRKLSDAERDAVVDASTAQALLRAHPSAIRRPLVEWPDGSISVGFEPEDWKRRFDASPQPAAPLATKCGLSKPGLP